ncbi:MAG: hypothetical protein AB7T49_17840 [Oligoflexales bacterium]
MRRCRGYTLLTFVTLSLSLATCKARTTASQAKDSEGQPCQLKAERELTDVVAKAAQAGCNTNPEIMLYAAGCTSQGRNVIAEKDPHNKPRIIDFFQCPIEGEDQNSAAPDSPESLVFFAHPDEIIAGDKATGAVNYYKYRDGNLVHQGNSFTKGNPCLRCHPTGVLNMKEISSPWRNWLGSRTDDLAEERALVGIDSRGQQRKSFRAKPVEDVVRRFSSIIATAYKKGLRNGLPDLANETLKDLLKPALCTVDVNLVTVLDDDPDEDTSRLLRNIFLLSGGFGFPSPNFPKLPGAGDVKNFFAANNIEADKIVAVPIPGDGSGSRMGQLADDIHGQDRIINMGLLVAIRSIDPGNTIFSKRRCGLLKHIPATPMSELKTPDAITKKVKEAMSQVNDPDAQKFLTLLEQFKDATVQHFLGTMIEQQQALADACSKPDSAVHDTAQIYRLYRARLIPLLQENPPLKYFDKLSVVEHFPGAVNSPSSMFPEAQSIVDGKYAADEGLGLTDDCKLTF